MQIGRRNITGRKKMLFISILINEPTNITSFLRRYWWNLCCCLFYQLTFTFWQKGFKISAMETGIYIFSRKIFVFWNIRHLNILSMCLSIVSQLHKQFVLIFVFIIKVTGILMVLSWSSYSFFPVSQKHSKCLKVKEDS